MSILEKILFHQIKNGDEQAFTIFYNMYRVKIYRFIYFKVSNKEKADDLVNDTFIKVFRYLRDGEEIENFQAFLYKTARNLVIDFYRTRKQEISLENAKEIEADIDISKSLDTKLDIENVAKAVKELPDNYKEIITLRFINNFSFDEISEATGKSHGNCRMLAHRGLKKLREILENEN